LPHPVLVVVCPIAPPVLTPQAVFNKMTIINPKMDKEIQATYEQENDG
jgi:hypothetical protein